MLYFALIEFSSPLSQTLTIAFHETINEDLNDQLLRAMDINCVQGKDLQGITS
jgi:hypothetical protein